MRTGLFLMYMKKASEDHRPMNCIREGGTPFSAKEVAPPARIDWPATSLSKKCLNRVMKKLLVGTRPLEVIHSGDDKGNRVSRD